MQRKSLKQFVPIGWRNYFRYFKYRIGSRAFEGPLPRVFSEIYHTNHWKGEESICGITSGIEQTSDLRSRLQYWLAAQNIRSVLDAPCGDFVWMREMDLRGIAYTGVDIVPEMILQNTERYGGPGISFHVLDITSDAIPRADLILCRDCLVHLSFPNIKKTLDRFLESESRYLACTSFVQNRFNYDIRDGDWRTLNMQKAPFSFPAPLAVIPDDCALGDGAFADKSLCIWSLDDIGKRSSKNAVHP
ncbi:MAG: class I SAM-dependent methyltransferase [Saprospiraceae bacterium]